MRVCNVIHYNYKKPTCLTSCKMGVFSLIVIPTYIGNLGVYDARADLGPLDHITLLELTS